MSQSNPQILWRPHYTIIVMVLVILACSPQITFAQQSGATAQAQRDDQKLLNGLRERQLFDLANDYCQKLLDSSDLPPQRRVTLTVHQLKNLTAKAVSSSGEIRDATWQQIDTIADRFYDSFRGSRAFLVRTQQSLAKIAQTRLIRQEIDVRLAQPGAEKTAITLLRSVRDELDETIGDIDKAIPGGKTNESSTDLSIPQLLALKGNLQFQYAVCNLERSQLYGADAKADRKDALSQAQEQIASATRTAEKGKTLWWEAKLASSKCLRLLGRNSEANATLKTLPIKLLPPNLKPQLRIERLRVALASHNPTQVGNLVSEALKQAQRPPLEEIGLVQATAWLASATNSEQAVRWKSISASLVKSVKLSHGRYWGRRAEVVLVDLIQNNVANNPSATSISPDTDLLILTKAAETALKEKRHQDAVDGFAKAILLAKRQSDYESVLRLSIQQGQLFEELGRHADAADLMIDSAIVKPDLRNAAAAHLRGCWNLLQTIAGADAPKQAERFQKSLEQHLQTWPTSSTTESALLWLGDQHSQNRNYRSAMETLLRVPTNNKRFPQAITQAATAASNILLKLEQTQQPLDLMTKRLIGQIREPAEKNPDLKAITELLAADIDIRFRSRLSSQQTLNEFEQDPRINDSGPAKLRLTELRLAIQTISKIKDADAFTKQLLQAQNKPAVQRRLHDYLHAMRIRNDSSNSTQTLATANLQVAQQAAADARQANQKERATIWELRVVELQSILRQHEQAIELLTKLVKEYPRKADLQIKLAQAMTAAYGKSDPEKPINQWRQLARRLRPESDNWFMAKYNVAELLHRSGKRDEALKLLKYIKANPPGWDNSKLKPDFDSLFQKLN